MTTATATTDRPILFNGEMIRAILGDEKTNTRRMVKWIPRGPNYLKHPDMVAGFYENNDPDTGYVLRSRRHGGRMIVRTDPIFCPYGRPGDRLWVRETWAAAAEYDGTKPSDIPTTAPIGYPANQACDGFKRRPSIFLPRWASRITLEVQSVRVERLQDITDDGIRAEGVNNIHRFGDSPPADKSAALRGQWITLWDGINAANGNPWVSNPWVWVVEFQRLDQETN